MTAQFFKDIKARILLKATSIKYVAMWNNQAQDIEDGKVEAFPLPAVFIEVVNEAPVKQLGNGVQLFDPLQIRFHIIEQFLNADDGTMEENLPVFTLKQELFSALQKFEPDNASVFIRTSEAQDYMHTNVYHYTQTYVTTFTDHGAVEPVGGNYKGNPTDGEIDLTIQGSSDPGAPHIYDISP